MNHPSDDDLTVLSSAGMGGMPPATADANAGADAGNSNGGHTLPAGTRLDEFDIVSVLGEGGFGVVYLAYDHSLERQVALKEYMPSFARRGAGVSVTVQSVQNRESFEAGRRSFINEARLLAKFDHPSLVKVYRFWEANGTAYMVMPYYRGPTLKQLLLAGARAPDEAWLRALLAPLLDALAVLHQDHCYHRDIAPDNILMLEEGRPLLLDFGAARRAVGESSQAFTVILKQNYAPIEQYAEMPGMGQGPWTDLYALASVVHFAIDGAAPPPAMSRMMSDPYVPLAIRYPDRYSQAFLAAIDRALAFRPDGRPQDVAEMRALLGLEAQAPGPTQAAPTAALPPAAPAPAAPSSPSSSRRLLLAGVGVAALAGAGLFALMNRAPEAPLAAAPAPAPAPAPLTIAPFDPAAAFAAVQAGADPRRQVSVDVATPRVAIDRDRLGFSVRSLEAGYVYIHMIGTGGDVHMLFPNGFDKDNRIAAGQTLALPRASWPIEAYGPAGTDRFVVMVSAAPRDFGPAGLVPDEPFARFDLAQSARLQAAHAGPAPLWAGAPACAGAPCPDGYGAASFTIEEVAP